MFQFLPTHLIIRQVKKLITDRVVLAPRPHRTNEERTFGGRMEIGTKNREVKKDR
jgi:hypothetical protein